MGCFDPVPEHGELRLEPDDDTFSFGSGCAISDDNATLESQCDWDDFAITDDSTSFDGGATSSLDEPEPAELAAHLADEAACLQEFEQLEMRATNDDIWDEVDLMQSGKEKFL